MGVGSVYALDARRRATAVEMLLQPSCITLQDPDVVAAALVGFRQKLSLGFSDGPVLEIARKAGHLPLETFDRDLAKLPGVQRL